MMTAKRRARLEQGLANTRAFRNWFDRLPQKAIGLDEYLVGTDAVFDHGKSVKEKVSCGAVGCVAGWLSEYPPYQSSDMEEGKFFGATYSQEMKLFGTRKHEDLPQKLEALMRLDHHIDELTRTLRKGL